MVGVNVWTCLLGIMNSSSSPPLSEACTAVLSVRVHLLQRDAISTDCALTCSEIIISGAFLHLRTLHLLYKLPWHHFAHERL